MRISVVIPAYNVAAWIGDAVGSVLAQSHADWAVRIVDDGSTDETAAVAARFSDPRIRLIRQANAGVAAARNRGGAETDGDAILFLDADDWLASDALARLAASLSAAPEAVAAFGPFRFVPEEFSPGSGPNPARSLPGSGPNRAPFLPGSGDSLLRSLLDRNPFVNGGHVLIRRAAAERAGGFLPGLAYGEDWEYWIRLALRGAFVRARGNTPILYARQRRSGAYLRMANDPDSFRPCMDTIFGNSALIARLGPREVAGLRARAEAENRWIVGRELIRHGRISEGRAWLRRSVAEKPSPKRAVLLAAAHALPVLPVSMHGPFRAYTSFPMKN